MKDIEGGGEGITEDIEGGGEGITKDIEGGGGGVHLQPTVHVPNTPTPSSPTLVLEEPGTIGYLKLPVLPSLL